MDDPVPPQGAGPVVGDQSYGGAAGSDAVVQFAQDESYGTTGPDAVMQLPEFTEGGQMVPATPPADSFQDPYSQDAYSETPIQTIGGMKSDFGLKEEPGSRLTVRNHQFIAWLQENRKHTMSCKTLPLTLLTWCFFLFSAWCHGNVDNNFRMRTCLKGAMEEVKARHSVSGIGQEVKSVVALETVTSVEELWSWIELGLVPAMAGRATKPGFVRTFNQVVGQIQLREERFQSGECQVGSELSAYYRQGCTTVEKLSVEPYGVQEVNATDKAFLPGFGLGNQLSAYNQKRFFSWLDIRRPLIGMERAGALRTSKWIDSGSKSLEVIIALFNSETTSYAHIRVKLALQRGGLIRINLKVRTVWATMYTKWYHVLVDIVWVLCVLKFIANTVQKAVDNKKDKVASRSCCRRCCTLPEVAGGGYWLGLDWLGIVLALAIMAFIGLQLGDYSGLATKVGGLGIGPDPLLGNETIAQMADWENAYGSFYANNAGIVDDIERLMFFKAIHQLCMFWYTMVFLLRWFRGFRGQARISQITATLSSAIADMLHFAIIFAVIFVNFAIAGHVLFGSEITEWSTAVKALQSTMGMTFGKVDFAPMFEIAPYSALLWLAIYVVGVVMISMNMLLAILADHYGGVFHANNAGDKGNDIFGQMYAMLYEIYWNTTYVGRFLYRIIYKWFPKKLRKFKFKKFKLPQYEPEEQRLAIPYEELYWTCELDPLGTMDLETLMAAGCDAATAQHLLSKCEDEILRHLDEFYPLEFLFDEFHESMTGYYGAIDCFSDELRGWFSKESMGCAKIIPRQGKLDELSRSIQVAQHIEHKHHHHHSTETLEGEGHHKHHHRSHHRTSDDGSQHESGTHSEVASQSAYQSQGSQSAYQSQGSRR